MATGVSAAWGFTLAFGGQSFTEITYRLFLVEILHDGFWLFFMAMLLGGAISQNRFVAVRFGGLAGTFLILVIGSWAKSGVPIGPFLPELGRTLFFGSLLTSSFAFVGLEQIYRNARLSQRKGLKYLCVGVGAIFAYDIFLYSNAILADDVSDLLWSVRGIIVLMCVPLSTTTSSPVPSVLARQIAPVVRSAQYILSGAVPACAPDVANTPIATATATATVNMDILFIMTASVSHGTFAGLHRPVWLSDKAAIG